MIMSISKHVTMFYLLMHHVAMINITFQITLLDGISTCYLKSSLFPIQFIALLRSLLLSGIVWSRVASSHTSQLHQIISRQFVVCCISFWCIPMRSLQWFCFLSLRHHTVYMCIASKTSVILLLCTVITHTVLKRVHSLPFHCTVSLA